MRYWVVIVAPGVYTASVALPVRPSVWTYLYGASIDGTVTLLFPAALITSGISSPQWGFRGNGRRAVWDGTGSHTINGITGDWSVVYGSNPAVPFFPQMHLIETGVVGNVEVAGTISGGGQLFMEHAVVGGLIQAATAGAFSLWADGTANETAGDIEGIGGIGGNVNMFHLSDVLVKSAQPTGASMVAGWRWTNVRLLDGGAGGGPFDFSLCGGCQLGLDEQTFNEYQLLGIVPGGMGFPKIELFILGGDPWKQVCEDGDSVEWDGADAVPTVLRSITALIPGSYHVLASAEVFKDRTIAGDVSVDFGLFLNGNPIPCTTRNEALNTQVMSVGGSLSIDKIVAWMDPGDVVTFQGVAPLNLGECIVSHYNLKAIKVGDAIVDFDPG